MSGKSSSKKKPMISAKTTGSRTNDSPRPITLFIQNEPISGRLWRERMAAVSAD
jgi:hypothetical protein